MAFPVSVPDDGLIDLTVMTDVSALCWSTSRALM